MFETGKVLTDAHDVVPFRHSPARNALISLSSCSVLVDDNGLYTSRAGGFSP